MRDVANVKSELESLKSSRFVTKWIMDATPFVFENNTMDYIVWREEIAQKMNVDPTDILISGSACLGFSINPAKNFKLFDEKSDIDVCIISPYYFDTAWRDLLQLNPNRLHGKMKSALMDHRQRLIFWGTIATDKILPLLSFGPSWDKIINESQSLEILKDRDINFRIYKDRRSLRDYLIQGINKCKEQIWEEHEHDQLFE